MGIPIAIGSESDGYREGLMGYQHTCLHYVNNQPVNNQSVRKRFNIAKNNVSFASKIIADTLDAGFIKASDPDNASKKFASYVPFWT